MRPVIEQVALGGSKWALIGAFRSRHEYLLSQWRRAEAKKWYPFSESDDSGDENGASVASEQKTPPSAHATMSSDTDRRPGLSKARAGSTADVSAQSIIDEQTSAMGVTKKPAWQHALQETDREAKARAAQTSAGVTVPKDELATATGPLAHVEVSKAQALAVGALTMVHTQNFDHPHAVVNMLASHARSQPAFQKLLDEVASNIPSRKRLNVILQCIDEYSSTRHVRKVVSHMNTPHQDGDASHATTTANGRSDPQPRTKKEVVDETRVLDHVSGAAGHIVPNQDQLRIFKVHTNNVTKLLEAEKNQQPTDVPAPTPEKVSEAEWPLRFSWSYAKYTDQNGRSSKRSANDSSRHLKATVKYRHHPDCGFNGYPHFHEVPYPLSLLPKATFEALDNGGPDGAACSYCRRPYKPSPHQKKLFLVAQRLSWAAGTFGVKARSKNEEALWAVNYELGIEELVMLASQESVSGGKQSGKNAWFPYQSKAEADLVMEIVESAEVLSEASWEAWKYMADDGLRQASVQKAGKHDDDVLFVSEQPASDRRRSPRKSASVKQEHVLATPPSSAVKGESSQEDSAVCSSTTLVEMYSSLDKIERMAPMGARFLEVYAEKVHAEVCKQCWFEQTIAVDDEVDDAQDE
ncbi:hypothetical protein LTR85_002396 [Meristemomyces frigidus]|nr:hypothetical protein LTR85_002396 [Meristemomyces frigidus]